MVKKNKVKLVVIGSKNAHRPWFFLKEGGIANSQTYIRCISKQILVILIILSGLLVCSQG